ncbi:MAG: rhomboid family intramembrane serine protease [Polyangiaceae bacterium]|nr:rhomboid family intramembrane serine protease [Polyangiaceae bacterium]
MPAAREVRCPCGALNDEGFATCIRCGSPLGAEAAGAKPARVLYRPAAEAPPRNGPAVFLIGGLCAAVFSFQIALALKSGKMPALLGASSRADAVRVGALEYAPEAWMNEPWRLLSAGFVHFGILHFVLNMMTLVWLARTAEHLVGSARTLSSFIVTSVAGFTLTLAVSVALGDDRGITAGASAGILGIMGLIIGVLVRRRDPRWKPFAIQGVFYTFIFGFAVNVSNVGIAVNNAAHLGGLLAGLALGLAWGGASGEREGPITRGLAGLLLAGSIGSLVLSQASSRWHSFAATVL